MKKDKERDLKKSLGHDQAKHAEMFQEGAIATGEFRKAKREIKDPDSRAYAEACRMAVLSNSELADSLRESTRR